MPVCELLAVPEEEGVLDGVSAAVTEEEGVAEAVGAAVLDCVRAAVPEVVGAAVPEVVGAFELDTVSAAVPEAVGAAVPEKEDAAVPEAVGAAVPEGVTWKPLTVRSSNLNVPPEAVAPLLAAVLELPAIRKQRLALPASAASCGREMVWAVCVVVTANVVKLVYQAPGEVDVL